MLNEFFILTFLESRILEYAIFICSNIDRKSLKHLIITDKILKSSIKRSLFINIRKIKKDKIFLYYLKEEKENK